MRRRTIIAAGFVAGVPMLIMRAIPSQNDGLVFADIPDLPGFRQLDGGAVSASLPDPFVGLRAPGNKRPPQPLPRGELCAALFGPAPPAPGTVPIASFSDYDCPYCRDLIVRLAAREDPGLRIAWHELPLLGEASEAAARAALAADLQGAYGALQTRLLRARFQPTDSYVAEIGRSLGLDVSRLLADMHSEEIAQRLDTTARVAVTLGIAATPALVVGRTLVTGAITDHRLDRLIELERAAGPVAC